MSTGGFGRTYLGVDDDDDDKSQDDLSDAEQTTGDLDIDYAITDSGRTVAHLIAHLKEDDNMDFTISNSGRSLDQYDNTESRDNIDFDGPTQGFTSKEVHSVYGTRSKAKPIPLPSNVSSLMGTRSQASSQESAGSAFITGLMNQNSNQMSHTPPSAASYETRHFGKRPRAGVRILRFSYDNIVCAMIISHIFICIQSVSGRLRSASDLEENGIIDRQQKGVLKDLIIAGDEALQSALDKYEKGDKSSLQDMIQSGALSDRVSTDIDLLGDLDLDFLTVEDTSFSDSIDAIMGGSKGLSAPLPSKVVTNGESYMVTPAYDEEDTIGELDFNGGYGHDTDTDTDADNGSYASNQQEERDRRYRSNSLAYGTLANESGSTDNTPEMYDQWMDHEPNNREGGINIRRSAAHPIATGGLAASLAQYGKVKSEPKSTKTQQADEKRRVREHKKMQKDREKEEKKIQKELEKQEKKDRKDRDKVDQLYVMVVMINSFPSSLFIFNISLLCFCRKKIKTPKKAKEAKEQIKEKMEEEEEKVVESGTGRPRSMSDPNLKTSLDNNGLLQVERPDGWVGAYSPDSRKLRIDRFLSKRTQRVWTKSVKYDVRKNFADSRLRVKGRFVKKEDELLMRELMSLT